jgi:hypothetical protein
MATSSAAQTHNTGYAGYTGLGNMDMLKSQILTMFALRNGGNNQDGIFMAIWAIILITCIDAFFRFIPIVAARIELLGKEYVKNRMKQIPLVANISPLAMNINTLGSEEASITLIRSYDDKNKSQNTSKDLILETELVDAVIEFICSQDTARHLRYTNKYIMNNTEPINLTRDIIAKLERCEIDPTTNQVNSLVIRLSSTTLKISQMKEHLSKILGAYRAEKCNKLGGQKYYFNEFHIPPMPDSNGGYRWETAPKRITFNMTPFNTYKSIKNIFGAHIAQIRDRIDLFINHPEWYQQRGIPHTLGILLHGRPGCGKTSLIKAIARDTNRHVFNISLRKTTTQRQLLNLFFDENIAITNPANEASTITIPLDQRIYVIEDIDCMTNIVLDRNTHQSRRATDVRAGEYNTIERDGVEDAAEDAAEDVSEDAVEETMPLFTSGNLPGSMNTPIEFVNSMQCSQSKSNNYLSAKENKLSIKKAENQENKEEITLSFLLNLLDGVLETQNRILIITSNYPERLDKALIRPGRIDLNIQFDNANMKMILEMLEHFYNLTEAEAKKLELDSRMDRGILTPAEVIAVLCNNYNNVANAVANLNSLALEKANLAHVA